MSTGEREIALIGGLGPTLRHPAPAAEAYQASVFQAARQWAERHADSWYVVSAYHGLLSPTDVVRPCEEAHLAQRFQAPWAERVLGQLVRAEELALPTTDTLILLMRHELAKPLSDANRRMGHGWLVRVPLRGLSPPARVKWLLEANP